MSAIRVLCRRTGAKDDYRLKHFEHPELQQFRKIHLDPNFHIVFYIKPGSSRAASREGYWLCFGFKGAENEGSLL